MIVIKVVFQKTQGFPRTQKLYIKFSPLSFKTFRVVLNAAFLRLIMVLNWNDLKEKCLLYKNCHLEILLLFIFGFNFMLTSLYLTKTINRKTQDHFFCSDTPAMILLSKLGITFFPHVVLRRQIYHKY